VGPWTSRVTGLHGCRRTPQFADVGTGSDAPRRGWPILHALPEADSRLIKLETASDSELVEVELRHTALRDDAHDA